MNETLNKVPYDLYDRFIIVFVPNRLREHSDSESIKELLSHVLLEGSYVEEPIEDFIRNGLMYRVYNESYEKVPLGAEGKIVVIGAN